MVKRSNVNKLLTEKALPVWWIGTPSYRTGTVSCYVCAFNSQAQRGLLGLLQFLQTVPWTLLSPEPREHAGSSCGCLALGWVVLHPHVLQGAWTFHSTSFRQQSEGPASLAVLPLKWWVKSVRSSDRLDFLRVLKPESVFSLLLSPSTLLPSLK